MIKLDIQTLLPGFQSKESWGFWKEDEHGKDYTIVPGESLCESDTDKLKDAGFEWLGRYWFKWEEKK